MTGNAKDATVAGLGMFLVVLFLGVLVSLGVGCSPVFAQEAPKPAEVKAADATKDDLASLQAEIKQLKAQQAQQAKPPAPTPAEVLANTQKGLTLLFKTLRDQAYEACRTAGGTLSMSLNLSGKGDIQVTALTCALK